MTATAARTVITTPVEREIHFERTVNASKAKVWRAYTEPDLLSQWWGRGNRLDIERLELERGGHWRFVEHAPHGVSGFEGRYREVVPGERMIRSFEWDGMPAHVAIEYITFTDLGDGRTRISGVMQLHTPEERDGFLHSGMQGGMDASFAALERLLEA